MTECEVGGYAGRTDTGTCTDGGRNECGLGVISLRISQSRSLFDMGSSQAARANTDGRLPRRRAIAYPSRYVVLTRSYASARATRRASLSSITWARYQAAGSWRAGKSLGSSL